MSHAGRTLFLTSLATLILVATIRGQDQRSGSSPPQGGSVTGSRGGQGFGAVPTPPSPKSIIPNAKPVRSCESLATVSLPNTTIESAAVDPNNSGICRVSAFTTHPPAGDKVRIWIGIPTANWNGRFMGTGGGGFSGGSGMGINQPLAQGYAAGANAITRDQYERFWDQSVEQYGAVIGTDNPDLTDFRNRGGKAIVWHGWADQLISAEGTIDYYSRVQKQMGGPEKTSQFMRLFMAPGVGHCGGGSGPAPSGQQEALLEWVEKGKAPVTLPATSRDGAGAVTRSRPLCRYPLVAKYKGTGSTDDAANFVCSKGF